MSPHLVQRDVPMVHGASPRQGRVPAGCTDAHAGPQTYIVPAPASPQQPTAPSSRGPSVPDCRAKRVPKDLGCRFQLCLPLPVLPLPPRLRPISPLLPSAICIACIFMKDVRN